MLGAMPHPAKLVCLGCWLDLDFSPTRKKKQNRHLSSYLQNYKNYTFSSWGRLGFSPYQSNFTNSATKRTTTYISLLSGSHAHTKYPNQDWETSGFSRIKSSSICLMIQEPHSRSLCLVPVISSFTFLVSFFCDDRGGNPLHSKKITSIGIKSYWGGSNSNNGQGEIMRRGWISERVGIHWLNFWVLTFKRQSRA